MNGHADPGSPFDERQMSPAEEAALDRTLARLGVPATPADLVTRIISAVPQLPQDASSTAIVGLAVRSSSVNYRRLAGWMGGAAAVAAGFAAIILSGSTSLPQVYIPAGNVPAPLLAETGPLASVSPAATVAARPQDLAVSSPSLPARATPDHGAVGRPAKGLHARPDDNTQVEGPVVRQTGSSPASPDVDVPQAPELANAASPSPVPSLASNQPDTDVATDIDVGPIDPQTEARPRPEYGIRARSGGAGLQQERSPRF